tara:strand:- start:857 stop:1318 length:462 start_codon:yes stop_codon:yes gene_type:complete
MIPKHLNKNEIIVVHGGSDKTNRAALDSNKVDILLDPHLGNRRDKMHQRNSGLNQVLLKLAKKNNVAIGISFKNILKSKAEDLGRIIQNIKLCRKYKVKIVILEYEGRNEEDVNSLFKVLGMTAKEVKDSDNYEKEKLDFKKRYVLKGVKLVS